MTTNNTRMFIASASRARARRWTSREGSWTAHTIRAVSVTWTDVEAGLLPALGADGLAALLNAPDKVEAFISSRKNVVSLFGRGTRTPA